MNNQPPTESMNQSIIQLQGELQTLAQVLVGGLHQQLASYEIDAVEYTVLSVCLSAGAISINDLKKLLPIDPGLMTRTTNQLEDREFIVKTRSKDDRRLVVLSLTEKGSALTPEMARRVHEFYRLLVRDISLEELVGCIAAMEKMTATGEEPKEHPAPPAGLAQGLTIESSVGQLQGNVVKLLNVMFRGIQERVSPFKLAVAEYWAFITCFANEPITISNLSQHVPVSTARISRIVSKLEDRELVRKVRPRRDRRVLMVEMTDEGHALALELMASVGHHYASIARRVREDELADLLAFIERMNANAESATGDVVS